MTLGCPPLSELNLPERFTTPPFKCHTVYGNLRIDFLTDSCKLKSVRQAALWQLFCRLTVPRIKSHLLLSLHSAECVCQGLLHDESVMYVISFLLCKVKQICSDCVKSECPIKHQDFDLKRTLLHNWIQLLCFTDTACYRYLFWVKAVNLVGYNVSQNIFNSMNTWINKSAMDTCLVDLFLVSLFIL